ncbi:retrotransposon protein [Striga asiatica]|uniref:Retrotransposon protein n=1 Tax=Striga asiatica TaxID=4170 RepID=A0A5A7PJ99_STRAF|nr:retrotransposon protein [Striga asiatica]
MPQQPEMLWFVDFDVCAQRKAVAGGGQLTSGAIIADIAISIQKHAFNNTLRVLDLKEYDVILGCDWLYKHSPFALNLKTREFLITLEDDTLLSLKDCTSQDAHQTLPPIFKPYCNKTLKSFRSPLHPLLTMILTIPFHCKREQPHPTSVLIDRVPHKVLFILTSDKASGARLKHPSTNQSFAKNSPPYWNVEWKV